MNFVPLVLWKQLLEAALDQRNPSDELKAALEQIQRAQKARPK